MGTTQDVHVDLLIMHNAAKEHLSRLAHGQARRAHMRPSQGQAQREGLAQAQPHGVTHGPGARCEEQGQGRGRAVAAAVGAAASHSAVPKAEGAEEEAVAVGQPKGQQPQVCVR